MPPYQVEVEKVLAYLKEEQTRKHRPSSYPLRAALGLTLAALLVFTATNSTPAAPSYVQTNVLIAHGVGARPTDGLMGEVKKALEQKKYVVFAPQLPLGQDQNLDNWERTLSDTADIAQKKGPVILVGYSAGTSVILHLVHDKPPGTFCGVYGISGALEGNTSALYRKFKDPGRIMTNVRGNAALWHARNDATLNLRGAVDLSRVTGIPLLEIDQEGGHFSSLSTTQLTQKARVALRHIQMLSKRC